MKCVYIIVNMGLKRALVWYWEPFGDVIHCLGDCRRQWLTGSRSFEGHIVTHSRGQWLREDLWSQQSVWGAKSTIWEPADGRLSGPVMEVCEADWFAFWAVSVVLWKWMSGSVLVSTWVSVDMVKDKWLGVEQIIDSFLLGCIIWNRMLGVI